MTEYTITFKADKAIVNDYFSVWGKSGRDKAYDSFRNAVRTYDPLTKSGTLTFECENGIIPDNIQIFNSNMSSNTLESLYDEMDVYHNFNVPDPPEEEDDDDGEFVPRQKDYFNGFFANCQGVTEVEIPEGIKDTGRALFKCCHDLKKVILPKSLERIGEDAFIDCPLLTEIAIPENVCEIGGGAFAKCVNLERLSIPLNASLDSDVITNMSLFYGCSSLQDVQLPNTMKGIECSMFADCTSLRSINLPSSVIAIGNNAFENCSSLTYVYLPDSINIIGKRAFFNCKKLEDIHLPTSLKEMREELFAGCKSLKVLEVPPQVEEIKENAIIGNKVIISAAVKKIYGSIKNVTTMKFLGAVPPETNVALSAALRNVDCVIVPKESRIRYLQSPIMYDYYADIRVA